MTAGQLTKRATLLEPVEAVDADGQVVQSWTDRGLVWCNLAPRRGGESVMQARMESKNPAIITVRASTLTREITSEWQMQIDGRKYDVREDPQETADRAFLQFYAETRGRE
ncbi:phage head closure protein [Paracoccus sp. (in: a-proteobacteria)]|uniref:phage head closure protein n=1 Tax=Paracoccus sp. TaxID=267 RepID=UPI0028A9BF44|nr:phage head closure protein [Paracoccus sp. (in: a-proteobacteria)]